MNMTYSGLFGGPHKDGPYSGMAAAKPLLELRGLAAGVVLSLLHPKVFTVPK